MNDLNLNFGTNRFQVSLAGGFDIHYSIFDIYPPLEDSLFQSFFFNLTGRFFGRRRR
jgi:hypothetical protein